MTRRELQRWVADHAAELIDRGVRADFSFGPDINGGGSSWASFNSALGTGRLVRSPDGSTVVSVYAHLDGSCLSSEHETSGSVAQLAAIADHLTSHRQPGMG